MDPFNARHALAQQITPFFYDLLPKYVASGNSGNPRAAAYEHTAFKWKEPCYIGIGFGEVNEPYSHVTGMATRSVADGAKGPRTDVDASSGDNEVR